MRNRGHGLRAWRVLASTVACVATFGCGSTDDGTTDSTNGQPPPAGAAGVYYVRTDGGDAARCTGQADAAYPGSGTGQACAWNHPFQALPPEGTARLPGGATLVIGPGSYRMGLGAPGAETCERDAPWDCHMGRVPSGPSAGEPTRILGAGWSSGCTQAPELWGAERSDHILDLTGAQHVQVACLEITDHEGCVEFHSGGLACERDAAPYGAWASAGIVASDSSDVELRDLDVHGLASTGIHAGRLSGWTLEGVRIAGNGWVGWDGDIDGNDSNSGDIVFRHVRVEWNGCAETYPGLRPAGCWAQSAGGYGDGLGTGTTGGHWVFEDCAFLHNTSDGLDLLYLRQAGGSVEVRRTIAEGNAGNQIKASGSATIENTVIVGNCGFFSGAAFTFDVDECRAAGNALSLALQQGSQDRVTNTTITGEGDCLVIAECDRSCRGNELLRLRNNLLIGQRDLTSGGEQSCLFWSEGLVGYTLDFDYSLVSSVKGAPPCPGGHDQCGVAPGIANASIDAFDAHLTSGSAAIDHGTPDGAPTTDFDGQPRDSQPDIGAYERR